MFKNTMIVNSVKKSAFVGFAFASLVALSPAHAMNDEDNNGKENLPGRALYQQCVKPDATVTFDLENARVPGSSKRALYLMPKEGTESVEDAFMRQVTSNVDRLVFGYMTKNRK